MEIRNISEHLNGTTFKGIQYTIVKNAVPVNLEGADVRMSLKKNVSDGITIMDFSLEGGHFAITDAANGILQFKKQIITCPQCGTFHYDLLIETADKEINIYIGGEWPISATVTKKDG